MKRFFNQCGRYRRSIALLASGVLPEAGRGDVENHLAACAGCRKFFQEIKSVAAPLAGWEKNFVSVEPTSVAQQRWASAIQSAARPQPVRRFTPMAVLLEPWRQLIWPARRAWTGMAAAWLVLWGINLGMSDAHKFAASTAAASPAMFQSLEEQRRLLAELIPPVTSEPSEPPRRNPQPRSERRDRFMMV